ncbi:HD-GYP domain-containing protein [Magnetovibrio sp.]|uniref:HD-GYP domain-containing protein n=1 Tax=Magnetovibrio sp. TaxID=2024836 RepID=UPI002F93496F
MSASADTGQLNDTLNARLATIHAEIKAWFPFINRISVALYDTDTDVLKTFINSSDDGSPLDHYEAKLGAVPSLEVLAAQRAPRTINDLAVLSAGDSVHTSRILEQGYLSSHTVPIVHNEQFHGFVFFNASERGYFTDTVVYKLGVYAQLVGLLCITEFNAIHTLQAAVKTAREISQYRDEETGSHLIRMSNISRIIALEMAQSHDLTDEFIEFLFHFAPLHDIGKIAIPDSILLKEGAFSDTERAIMETHVPKGVEIVEKLIHGFKMESMPKIEMLKNIVLAHHEALDGSGYPQGLKGAEIPLEARIVAVADVFDALTSARPYKKAWSNDEAFAFLNAKTSTIFDPECVAALARRRDQVEAIQKRFQEDVFG